MKTNKIKKILATAMVISTSTTILPVSTMAMATSTNQLNSDSIYVDSAETSEAIDRNNDTDYFSEEFSDVYSTTTTASAVYYNDFESGKLPDEVNWKTENVSSVNITDIAGSKALEFNPKFDGTDNWDNNQTSFSFNTTSTETIKADSTIQFDMLIPKSSADFAGQIKFSGAVKDKNYTWIGAGYGSVATSDFKDEGNGYLRTTVSIKTSKDSDELTSVILQISSYNCTYTGDIYIDNIKLTEAEAQDDASLPTVSDMEWNFDADDNGWSYGGSWDYKGPTDNVVNYDASTIGNGALKLSVDYSKDASVSWSEFKINNNLASPIDFNGYNILTYDFIYDPSKMTTGGFQTKLFISDSLNTYGSIDLSNVEDIGGGLKKAQVTLKFTSQDVQANSITLGIIGSNTDYKGDVYIDNIKFSQEQVADKYAEKKVEANNSQTIVSNDKLLEMPSTVKLVDANSTGETADLYSYLMGVGKSDYVLYGHQNDTHHKAGSGSTNSDTKDITGSIAAITGIDALSLTGAELSLTDDDKANGIDLISKAAQLGIDASKEGGIVTLSAHMPNFELVKEKGKDTNGNYDYSGYTPGTTTGNIVSRIMPGGDLNDVYVGYLDILATYAHKLEDAGVPVIFRPFHENNGSWFWWGKAYCDEEAYKNMYRYTVEYLRDTENVHNFLYVYSPNGPFENEEDYLSRYPGDEFVDILAFDYYDDNPTEDYTTDPWMKSFKNTIDLIQDIAENKGKVSAVSEVGLRNNDNHGFMAISGNVDKDWFSHVANIVSGSDMPYYMTWANFGETSGIFAPYMISDTKGHEMINDFIDYYNEEESVFADGVGDYSSANTGVGTAYSYGFITGPTSSSRILSPTTITASVKGYDGQVVKFVLKNKAGESVKTLNATKGEDGLYSADITQDTLDKIGQTIGSIELYAGSNTIPLNTIKAIFNIKEAEINPKVVDDFESYTGEDALLQNAWPTNAGPGCSVTPKLSGDNKNGGEYGLAFNYKLAPNGWAGITKSLDADWSGSDALQLWVKPDGKGQKLVIQLTSNGEDFEVWMPEFAATTEAKLLTIKFSDMKGKKGGTLDPANIEKMGIWCNTIGNDNIDSVMYFDNIKSINTSAVENPDDGNSNSGGGSNSGGNSNSGGGSHSSGNSSSNSGSTTTDDTNSPSNGNTSTKNNWIQENGTWKYVDESGVKVSNTWKQVNGKWYYFNQDSTMKTGWLKDKDNNWYYLQSDGAMKTDWVKDKDGNWYYLQSNGAMKTGWLLDKDSNWYYLQSSGAMKTGWFKDTDGNWYYLKANGAMARNEYINGYWLGRNGAWK